MRIYFLVLLCFCAVVHLFAGAAQGEEPNEPAASPVVRPRPSAFEFAGIATVELPQQDRNVYSVGDLIRTIEAATQRRFEVPEDMQGQELIVLAPPGGAQAGDLLYLIAAATNGQWLVRDDQSVVLNRKPIHDRAIDLATASLIHEYRRVVAFLTRAFPIVMAENLGDRFVLPQRRWIEIPKEEQKWLVEMLSVKEVYGDPQELRALLTGTDNQRVTVEYLVLPHVTIEHEFASRWGLALPSPRIVQPDPRP